MPLSAILIEDSKTIRDSLIPALRDLANVQVIALAESAPDAAIMLTGMRDAWQIAIVDLFLREGSGLDVLRTLQRRLPHQRAAVLTNYPTTEMRERTRELGADALFDKSAELEQFFRWCNQQPLAVPARHAASRWPRPPLWPDPSVRIATAAADRLPPTTGYRTAADRYSGGPQD